MNRECPLEKDVGLSYIHNIREDGDPEFCTDGTFRNDINRFAENPFKIDLQSRMVKKAGIFIKINQNIYVTSRTGFIPDDGAEDANSGDVIGLNEICPLLFQYRDYLFLLFHSSHFAHLMR